MQIDVYCENGWYVIEDSDGNQMRYLYYTKREAVSKFKSEYGHKHKRVTLVDHTKSQKDGET